MQWKFAMYLLFLQYCSQYMYRQLHLPEPISSSKAVKIWKELLLVPFWIILWTRSNPLCTFYQRNIKYRLKEILLTPKNIVQRKTSYHIRLPTTENNMPFIKSIKLCRVRWLKHLLVAISLVDSISIAKNSKKRTVFQEFHKQWRPRNKEV